MRSLKVGECKNKHKSDFAEFKRDSFELHIIFPD